MIKSNKFSPEVRKRAVRMVLEHREKSIAVGGSRVAGTKDRLRSSHAVRMDAQTRG